MDKKYRLLVRPNPRSTTLPLPLTPQSVLSCQLLQPLSNSQLHTLLLPDYEDALKSSSNLSVVCVGQRGTGKSFSLMGGACFGEEREKGLIQQFFEFLKNYQGEVYASAIQIHLEQINDLTDSKAQLNIHQNQKDGVYIQGLSEHRLEDQKDLDRLLLLVNKNRKSNGGKSSSFVLVQFICQMIINQKIQRFKVSFIDSPGNGKLHIVNKGSHSELAEEMANKRCMALFSRVFQSLSNQQKPSYRQCKLSYILKDCLTHTGMCVTVLTASFEQEDMKQTNYNLKLYRFCGLVKCCLKDSSLKLPPIKDKSLSRVSTLSTRSRMRHLNFSIQSQKKSRERSPQSIILTKLKNLELYKKRFKQKLENSMRQMEQGKIPASLFLKARKSNHFK